MPALSPAPRRLLILEINEFSETLLFTQAERLGLKNILYLKSLSRRRTRADHDEEHVGLDPWVQWPSFHLGLRSSEHQQWHLNTTEKIATPQIWEDLSELNKTSLVWNVLNGRRGTATKCIQFVPDIWSLAENTYPAKLGALREFPQYFAKNRLHFSWLKGATLALRFLWAILPPAEWPALVAKLPLITRAILKNPRVDFWGFAVFEYFAARRFYREWKLHRPDLGILFLNSLAHVEHFHWHNDDGFEVEFILRLLDEIVGLFLPARDFSLLALNGFSQEHDPPNRPFVYYRFRDPHQLLKTLGIAYESVDELMSYDAHLLFSSSGDLIAAQEKLARLKVGGRPLFALDPVSDRKLYCQVHWSEPLTGDVAIEGAGQPLQFLKYFGALVQRTAGHVPEGCLFTDLPLPQKDFGIHELKGEILKFFGEPR